MLLSISLLKVSSAAVKQRQVGGEGLEERTKNGDMEYMADEESVHAGMHEHTRTHAL